MTDEKPDILLDIPDEDLPKLAEMYEKHKDLLPEVYGIITTGIEWRKKRKEKYLVFMSPNGCWREDGTFFVLLTHGSFDIFLFSLDESGKNIYEGIRKTRRLDTGEYTDRLAQLHTTNDKFYPIIAKAFKENGRPMAFEMTAHRFVLAREKALKFEIECPPEVYIKKLDKSHAALVNSEWPHNYKNSDKCIALLIEMNGAYGVFLKSNDELVAWTLISMLGQLSFLQTVESQKKKGYGSLIVKYVSKVVAQKGHSPFATALLENMAAVNTFRKLGYESLGRAMFTLVNN